MGVGDRVYEKGNGRRVLIHKDGTFEYLPDTRGMQTPVQCLKCGEVYDLGHVTVTSRYADCSVWETPCCGKVADDRLFKSLPDIRPLPAG